MKIERPGYFGRRRDQKIKEFNELYGEGNWGLKWCLDGLEYDFLDACKFLYERSYFLYLKDRPKDIDFICSHGECYDNAVTNIQSGLDYSKQESFSTHIQDIAVRNVIHRLGRKFEGPADKLLEIRSKGDGLAYSPGVVPFLAPDKIDQPSLCPKWAGKGSVEDFWQSNKWLVTNGSKNN